MPISTLRAASHCSLDFAYTTQYRTSRNENQHIRYVPNGKVPSIPAQLVIPLQSRNSRKASRIRSSPKTPESPNVPALCLPIPLPNDIAHTHRASYDSDTVYTAARFYITFSGRDYPGRTLET